MASGLGALKRTMSLTILVVFAIFLALISFITFIFSLNPVISFLQRRTTIDVTIMTASTRLTAVNTRSLLIGIPTRRRSKKEHADALDAITLLPYDVYIGTTILTIHSTRLRKRYADPDSTYFTSR